MPALTNYSKEEAKILKMKATECPEGVTAQNLAENDTILLDEVLGGWFYVSEDGFYDVIVKMTVPMSNLAQCVCKAQLNGEELSLFQTNGTFGRWIFEKLLRVELEKGYYHLTIEFPKPGMKVAHMEFKRKK